jgi:hypothetical protein
MALGKVSLFLDFGFVICELRGLNWMFPPNPSQIQVAGPRFWLSDASLAFRTQLYVLKINLNSDFKIIVTQCALYTTLSLIFR